MPSGCETCPKCGEETLQPFKGRASCLRVTDCGYSEKREPSLRAQVAHLEKKLEAEREWREALHTCPVDYCCWSAALADRDRILKRGE